MKEAKWIILSIILIVSYCFWGSVVFSTVVEAPQAPEYVEAAEAPTDFQNEVIVPVCEQNNEPVQGRDYKITLEPVEPIDHYHYPIVWANCKKISLDDFKLLCTTVYCESGNQSYNCQYLTALCILNRLVREDFPNTMTEVIYQKNQFAVTNWKCFEDYGYTEQVEAACFEATIRNDHPDSLVFFRTNYYFDWAEDYIQDGVVCFSLKK